ncbi:hypothetical protein J3459_008245 [Metarhizium acridum]|nr:hypothetical protein J3459_008245 [Metarhizium acridum]
MLLYEPTEEYFKIWGEPTAREQINCLSPLAPLGCDDSNNTKWAHTLPGIAPIWSVLTLLISSPLYSAPEQDISRWLWDAARRRFQFQAGPLIRKTLVLSGWRPPCRNKTVVGAQSGRALPVDLRNTKLFRNFRPKTGLLLRHTKGMMPVSMEYGQDMQGELVPLLSGHFILPKRNGVIAKIHF